MYKIWIFLGLQLVQPMRASEAEDFNPYDHIIQKPKPEITNDEENDVVNNLNNNNNVIRRSFIS